MLVVQVCRKLEIRSF